MKVNRVSTALVCPLFACCCLLFCRPMGAWAASIEEFRARKPQDEAIYFVLPDRFANGDPSNDRGGLSGDRLTTGYDPTAKGFFHGGDLRGLIERLDYIQGLGATAVWLGPVFQNKSVQGPPGRESAGYHGYWITDFTHVDAHFGGNSDLHALVDAAHARGLKIYLDIVVNHTADVIQYRECSGHVCPYRSRAQYPYTRRGGIGGAPINDGFMGDEAAQQTDENFAKLTRPDYAYTPFVPAGEEHLKVPEWLNDLIVYHNSGNSTFSGESSQMGDFDGLDDLMTENPRVVRGFIEIYGKWIDDYGIDGFRIDTAKHVNAEFWQAFVPAILARAAARGIPNFHVFGEVATGMDPALLAEHTRVDKLPAVLDFAFAAAVRDTVAGNAGTDELARLFDADPYTKAAPRPRCSCRLSSATTMPAASPISCANRGLRRGIRSCSHACAWRTRCCSCCAACRSFITATSKASPAPAEIRIRARICSRARSRSTTPSRSLALGTRRRPIVSIPAIRCMRR
jgi:hypothetical protein